VLSCDFTVKVKQFHYREPVRYGRTEDKNYVCISLENNEQRWQKQFISKTDSIAFYQ
jgi:hypothetical protein